MIDLLGNATIGNDHFDTLGKQKKKKEQWTKSAASPPGSIPVLPMASPCLALNYTIMLNGYSQWLNIKGKKRRDIISIDISDTGLQS